MALVIVWMIGLLVGAIDLLGFFAAALLTVFGAWFVASLGVLISSQARNGTRALAATFLIMFASGWVWPSQLWHSLIAPRELATMGSELGAGRTLAGTRIFEAVIDFGVVAALYAGAAGVLTYWSVRRLRGRWGGS